MGELEQSLGLPFNSFSQARTNEPPSTASSAHPRRWKEDNRLLPDTEWQNCGLNTGGLAPESGSSPLSCSSEQQR